MNDATVTVQVTIRGRVQGVGFLTWVEYAALTRLVEGWVRNRRDGSVEAVFAGPAEDVASMVEACRHGPRGARVDGLEQRPGDAHDLAQRRPGERFSVLATM